jgi:putative transposase
MLIVEAKLKGKDEQFRLVDEAIWTVQFVRNKALRFWMDKQGKSQYDPNKYCVVLAKEFDWANKLNSQAQQAAAEPAWSAIARFFDNCKRTISGKICKCATWLGIVHWLNQSLMQVGVCLYSG